MITAGALSQGRSQYKRGLPGKASARAGCDRHISAEMHILVTVTMAQFRRPWTEHLGKTNGNADPRQIMEILEYIRGMCIKETNTF